MKSEPEEFMSDESNNTDPVRACSVAYRDALYGTRWIKQLRDMEPGTQWFIEGRAEPIATVTSHASVTWHMAASEIPHGTAYYTAPPSAPMGVAYLDIGAGGYMDLGSELSDEELAKLPYGRHVLGIIGTHGVDGYVLAQQPAAVDDAKDAARYRWLKENHNADLLAEDVIDEAMSNQCDIKWRGCIP